MSLEWEVTKKYQIKGKTSFVSVWIQACRTVNTRPVQLKPNELTAWAWVSAASYYVGVTDVNPNRKSLCDVCGVTVCVRMCECMVKNTWTWPQNDTWLHMNTLSLSLFLWSPTAKTRSGCEGWCSCLQEHCQPSHWKSLQIFFTEDILTCHCRKSRGVNNRMKDVWILVCFLSDIEQSHCECYL